MGSALAFVIEVEASLERRTECPLLGVVEGMVTGDRQGTSDQQRATQQVVTMGSSTQMMNAS